MGKFRIHKVGYIEGVQNLESDVNYGFNQPIDKLYIGQNRVKKVCKGSTLIMDGTDTSVYRYFYMYATNAGGGTVSLQNNGNNAPDVEYSRDGVNWTTWDYSSISLQYTAPDDYSDEIIYPVFFRGNNSNGFNSSSSNYSKFVFSSSVDVVLGGNIMSLIDKTNFNTLETLPNTYCFNRLFLNATAVKSTAGLSYSGVLEPDIDSLYNLRLPAKILTQGCYEDMFSYTGIIDASKLSIEATTMAKSSCSGMFSHCDNLVVAPKLPATTLAESCYAWIFCYCPNLEIGPDLLAEVTVKDCYMGIFYWSRKIKYIKCLATTIYNNCMSSWCSGAPSSGTFVKKAGVTFPSGASGIPSGWTVEEI